MGADSTLCFYGVRFATTDSESNGLEDYSDPRVRKAREHGLDHWWGSFAVDEYNEQYFLFIGMLFGTVGGMKGDTSWHLTIPHCWLLWSKQSESSLKPAFPMLQVSSSSLSQTIDVSKSMILA